MRGKTIVVLALLLALGVAGGFGLGSWYLKQDTLGKVKPADGTPAGPTTGASAGEEALRLTRVAPLGDGAQTPRIEVEFDAAPKDAKVIEAGFSILPSLAGTLSWQDRTLVFQPTEPFKLGHLYTVRLEAEPVIPGLEGRLINGKATEWSFVFGSGPSGVITGIEYYGAGYQFARVEADGSRQALAPLPPDKSVQDGFWSPSGDRLLFQAGFLYTLDMDNHVQQVIGLEQGEPQPYHANWSPDGRAVVFQRSGHLYTMSLSAGAAPKELNGSFSGSVYPVWSPAGGRIAVRAGTEESGQLWLVPTGSGEAKSLSTGVSGFAWSPDGQVLAYIVGSGESADLHIYDVGTGKDQLIGKVPGGRLCWSPDRARLAILRGDRLWSVGVDGSGLTPVARGVRDSATSVVWSPSGAYLAYVDAQGHLWRARGDGEDATQLTKGQEQWMLPRWSKD